MPNAPLLEQQVVVSKIRGGSVNPAAHRNLKTAARLSAANATNYLEAHFLATTAPMQPAKIDAAIVACLTYAAKSKLALTWRWPSSCAGCSGIPLGHPRRSNRSRTQ
jgi:hypothetical protein